MGQAHEPETTPVDANTFDDWALTGQWEFQPRPGPEKPWWYPHLAVGLLLLHGLGLYCLYRLMLPMPRSIDDDVVRLVIEFPPLASNERVVVRSVAAQSADTVVDAPANADTGARLGLKSSRGAVRGSPSAESPLAAPSGRLRLQLSDRILREIPDPFAEDRQFEYQTPGLRESQRWLKSPQVLEYQATRFDKDWRPTQNLLDDMLERAVEKTTPEIKIRIPGVKDGKLVCRVSLLALGGGCGFVPNHGYRPYVDDPNTLDAQEFRECEAWYEKIRTAPDESTWLRTRELYEAECRKPREKQGIQAPQVGPRTPKANTEEAKDRSADVPEADDSAMRGGLQNDQPPLEATDDAGIQAS